MNFALFYQVIGILLILTKYETSAAGKFYTTNENKEYYINTDRQYTWGDSIVECLKLNMTLASIETSSEQESLMALKNTTIFEIHPALWVGGLMISASNNYTWIETGKSFNYTNWYSGQPIMKSNYVLFGYDVNMKWATQDFSNNYGFICEHRQKYDNEIKENIINEVQERENLRQELEKEKKLFKNLMDQLLQQFNANELKAITEKMDLQPKFQLEKNILDKEQQQKEYKQKERIEEYNKKYINYIFPFSSIQTAYLQPNANF